jgi:putative acetyltransferase
VIERIEIRESVPDDWDSVELLYPDAFPDEDLLPLVRELFQKTPSVLSLVGVFGSSLVGHVIFTPCRVAGGRDKVALLGPLAVASARQRKGIGTALVHAGFQRLENDEVSQAYVLGDPDYYRRFGFKPETVVAPPYSLPAEWREAWQSISLLSTKPPQPGTLCLPQPWLQPALWMP